METPRNARRARPGEYRAHRSVERRTRYQPHKANRAASWEKFREETLSVERRKLQVRATDKFSVNENRTHRRTWLDGIWRRVGIAAAYRRGAQSLRRAGCAVIVPASARDHSRPQRKARESARLGLRVASDGRDVC